MADHNDSNGKRVNSGDIVVILFRVDKVRDIADDGRDGHYCDLDLSTLVADYPSNDVRRFVANSKMVHVYGEGVPLAHNDVEKKALADPRSDKDIRAENAKLKRELETFKASASRPLKSEVSDYPSDKTWGDGSDKTLSESDKPAADPDTMNPESMASAPSKSTVPAPTSKLHRTTPSDR